MICWNLKGIRWIRTLCSNIFCTNQVRILVIHFVVKGIKVRWDCTVAADALFSFSPYRIFWLNPIYWNCLILLPSFFNPLFLFLVPSKFLCTVIHSLPSVVLLGTSGIFSFEILCYITSYIKFHYFITFEKTLLINKEVVSFIYLINNYTINIEQQ
jgi:hypothetical protein